MICLSVFSYFILKSKLYIHQYVSLFIMIIIGISLNVINLTDDKNDNHDNKELLVHIISLKYHRQLL